MASHRLISAHLAALAERLPGDAVDELTDGLTETWQRHLAAGLGPDEAARTAIAEFGTPDQIVRAFVREAPGRRAAIRLMSTGPLVGACWGAALLTAHAWAWPVPAGPRTAFGVALLLVAGALTTAVIGERRYRRTRLAAGIGSVGLIGLDAAMLVAVLGLAPVVTWPTVWPLALAVPASLARIAFTARALPAVLTR